MSGPTRIASTRPTLGRIGPAAQQVGMGADRLADPVEPVAVGLDAADRRVAPAAVDLRSHRRDRTARRPGPDDVHPLPGARVDGDLGRQLHARTGDGDQRASCGTRCPVFGEKTCASPARIRRWTVSPVAGGVRASARMVISLSLVEPPAPLTVP